MQARPVHVGLSVAKNLSFSFRTHTVHWQKCRQICRTRAHELVYSCTRLLFSVSDRPAGRMRSIGSGAAPQGAGGVAGVCGWGPPEWP